MHLWSDRGYPFDQFCPCLREIVYQVVKHLDEILVLKYQYLGVNQQQDTVVFPQTLGIQSDHLKTSYVKFCLMGAYLHSMQR